ncbi:MAG TPA: flagellar basal body protein [Acidimicrobiales bacterium]
MPDVTTAGLHVALNGLSARQRVIADNIANLETPEFLAGRVDFESSLSAALSGDNPASAEITTERSMAATGVNGNNVNLDEETLALIETDLRYQVTSQAISSKFALLRTAIGRGY